MKEAFKEGRFNKIQSLMAGVTKTEGSIFISMINNSVLHDNMTKDDFTQFFRVVAKTYPGISDKLSSDIILKIII